MAKIEEKPEKRTFTHDNITYAVRRPTMQELVAANKLQRKTFNEALQEDGSLLRDQINSELRKRKLWSDELEQEYQTLRTEIVDLEFKLARGGIKLNDAKSMALEMRDKRSEMVQLLSARTELDSNSCEGRADAVRFNYLFAHCLVYDETGEAYFVGGLDDYLLNQEHTVALLGATEFFYLMSETDEVDSKLAENKFLRKYRFVNDSYQLIDKDGHLVDDDGHHIDEAGNFITWKSDTEFVYVDIEGREIDKEGNFHCEADPFLDDDGKPIDDSLFEVSEEEEKEPEVKKRRTSKKSVTKAEESVSVK